MSKINFDTPWRKMAAALYLPPTDSRTYGMTEIDCTRTMAFIREQKEKGLPLTVTHFTAAAIGRALELDVPEINAYVKRGRVLPRPSADVFVAVKMKKMSEMSGFRLKNAGQKSLTEIADEFARRVENVREDKEKGAQSNKYILARIPWPFRRPVFLLLKWIVVTLGIDLKFLRFSAHSFGSALLTNVGTWGLEFGFPALMPASNLGIVIAIGKVAPKAVVRDGEIVIRDMMPIVAVLDHRVIDGSQGGKLANAVKYYFNNPEALLKAPDDSEKRD